MASAPNLEDLVRRDYAGLVEEERLDTEQGVAELILAQSIEGHAHTGAGAFHKRRYPDLVTHRIVELLGWNVTDCRRARQALIDEITDWVEVAVGGSPRKRLVDAAGHPLLRVPWLAGIEVEPREVLRGFYIGGLRDDEAVRARAEKAHGVEIGGGRCFVVDTRVMKELGEDPDRLAHEAHDEARLEEFRRTGMLADAGKITVADVDDGPYEYNYIRYRVGPGHSDDAAIIGAGLLYGTSTALGAWLADAVDTLEKFSARFSDQDDELAAMVGGRVPEAKVPESDLELYVVLCAIAPGKEEKVPDSSTRHLLSVYPKTGKSLLRAHLDFLEGLRGPAQPMSHGQTTTHDFYAYLVRRLSELQRRPSVLPRRAAEELMSTGFAVVGPGAGLAEMAALFADPEVELLVVCGEDGAPRGVVRAADVLRLVSGSRPAP
jgi:hypothetical protein